jgi:transposase
MVSTKNLKLDTMEDIKRVARRPHSEALKARVLAECSQQGVSVAKVAQAHGLNANLVHKWRRAAEALAANIVALRHEKG